MGHLIRIAAFLTASFAIVILASQLAGAAHREAKSELPLLFTNPDGTPCTRPCLLGVRPGITSYDQVVAILKTHPLTREYPLSQPDPNDRIYRRIDVVGAGIQITLFSRDKQPVEFFTIQYIHIPVDGSTTQILLTPPTVRDVVEMFGLPDTFSIIYRPAVQLHYDRLLFLNYLLALDPSRLDLDDPIYYISVGVTNEQAAGNSLKWRGFASFRRYVYQ